MKGKGKEVILDGRELSDSDADLPRSTPGKVTNHPNLPGNFPILALKVLHLGKSLSPSKPGQLVTLYQPNGELGNRDCPAEESCLGWKWPGL